MDRLGALALLVRSRMDQCCCSFFVIADDDWEGLVSAIVLSGIEPAAAVVPAYDFCSRETVIQLRFRLFILRTSNFQPFRQLVATHGRRAVRRGGAAGAAPVLIVFTAARAAAPNTRWLLLRIR